LLFCNPELPIELVDLFLQRRDLIVKLFELLLVRVESDTSFILAVLVGNGSFKSEAIDLRVHLNSFGFERGDLLFEFRETQDAVLRELCIVTKVPAFENIWN